MAELYDQSPQGLRLTIVNPTRATDSHAVSLPLTPSASGGAASRRITPHGASVPCVCSEPPVSPSLHPGGPRVFHPEDDAKPIQQLELQYNIVVLHSRVESRKCRKRTRVVQPANRSGSAEPETSYKRRE